MPVAPQHLRLDVEVIYKTTHRFAQRERHRAAGTVLTVRCETGAEEAVHGGVKKKEPIWPSPPLRALSARYVYILESIMDQCAGHICSERAPSS